MYKRRNEKQQVERVKSTSGIMKSNKWKVINQQVEKESAISGNYKKWQALFVVSVLTAKPIFVVSVLTAKTVFVVSVGLRVLQKNLEFINFL